MTWTKETFIDLYARFAESGLTIRDFCSNEGINESRFYYWKKRCIEEPQCTLQSTGDFLPVNLSRQGGRLSFSRKCPTRQGHLPIADSVCEINYPNGVVVRLSGNLSPDLYKALVLLN